jgi:hypothetical protein
MCFRLQIRNWETATLLGHLERANLKHYSSGYHILPVDGKRLAWFLDTAKIPCQKSVSAHFQQNAKQGD